jgi:Tetratricopeptide repeat
LPANRLSLRPPRRDKKSAAVPSTRLGLTLKTSVLVVSLLVRRAEAQDKSTYEQKGTTAFALGHFADAAEDFEKAFELKPDPALLYNAAQAYRLAGDKERALTLYENYLRVYGKKEKRAGVETHIEELKQAIARDKAVATSPPTRIKPAAPGPATPTPAPVPVTPPPASPSPPVVSSPPDALPMAPPPPSATPVLVATATAAPDQDDSITRKPWFWVAVGGGVLVAAVVAVLLATGGSKDPSASIGMANGN